MKKATAILLALIMIIALAACSTDNAGTSGSPSTEASSSPSASTSAGASTSPSSTPASNASPTLPTATVSEGPVTSIETTSTIGFWEDALESAASGRGKYHIVMMTHGTATQWSYLTDMSAMFEGPLNVTISEVSAGGDADRLMAIAEEQASDKTVDGFILDVTTFYQERVLEILTEYNKPHVSIFDIMWGGVTDPETRTCLGPSVVVDPYTSGAVGIQWCAENYKTYWGEIDTSKLGFCGATLSSSYDMNQRAVGAWDAFAALFPEASGNMWYADAAVGGFNADTFYQEVSTVLTAHPEVEHWFVYAASGDSGGVGSVRGIEESGKNDCTIFVSGVPTTAVIEWDSGSLSNSWVASVDQSYALTMATALSGVIAMIDGRATMSTLWEDSIKPGDASALLEIPASVMTRDSYKESRNVQYEAFGLEKPYPDI